MALPLKPTGVRFLMTEQTLLEQSWTQPSLKLRVANRALFLWTEDQRKESLHPLDLISQRDTGRQRRTDPESNTREIGETLKPPS